jgi:uncharacterized C2H2 Zn-finger protein
VQLEVVETVATVQLDETVPRSNESETLKCPLCSFIDDKSNSLTRHISKHKGMDGYEKALQFVKDQAKQRRKRYLQTPRQCPFCLEEFPSLSSQYHHTRFRCSKNPQCLKGHLCDICGTQSASAQALQKHRARHKTHDCKECGASYQKRSAFVSHQRRKHMNIQNYLHLCRLPTSFHRFQPI